MVWEWARDLALCAAFGLLVWAPMGRCALRKLGRGALPDNGSMCIGVGMGIWGLAVLALGLVGLLYRSSLLFLSAALIVTFRFNRHLFSRRMPIPRSSSKGRHGFLIYASTVLSGVFIALVLCSAPAPELAFDALNVHLPYARDSAIAHRVGLAANNWSSVMPALPLMSYITAFLFTGVTLAKLFNVLSYVLCGGVIFGFVRRWWGVLRASAAALLFWSAPVALYEATTALIDLPLALYSTLAVLSLLEWTRSENRSWLWLSASALGLALGCKYHAAFWLGPFILILLFDVLIRRRIRPLECAGLVFRYLLIAGFLFLPWLVRAWAYTGNPVFPLANSLFRSPLFPPSMEAASRAMYANEGVGSALPQLLMLPWTLTVHPGPFRGTPGILFLPGVFLALVRGKTRELRYGLFAAFCYFLTWALTAQEIRYMLPLLPLLSVLTAAGFLGAERANVAGRPAAFEDGTGCDAPSRKASNEQPRWDANLTKQISIYLGVFIIFVGSLAALPPIYPLWVKQWTYWHSYQSPLPFLLGRQSKEDYLRRDVPSIYVYDYVNNNLGPEDRILLLNDASQFYSRIPTLYSFTVEGEDLLHQTEEAKVLQVLRHSRITHVLLNYNGIAPLRGVVPRLGVYFFLDKTFQERHLEPVYSKNNVVLYRVRAS